MTLSEIILSSLSASFSLPYPFSLLFLLVPLAVFSLPAWDTLLMPNPILGLRDISIST